MFSFELVRWMLKILLAAFSVLVFKVYFDIFFESRKNLFLCYTMYFYFFLWQIIIPDIKIMPGNMRITLTIVETILVVSIIYKGKLWNKCIFSLAFNAMGMMVETLCGYVFIIHFNNYLSSWFVGAFLSKILLSLIIIGLRKVFTQQVIQELSRTYSIMLILIPVGSMYIVNYIFMLSSKTGIRLDRSKAFTTSVILLAINILIFYIYYKLVNDMHLKQRNLMYEQQLGLLEKHQFERETAMIQMRDVKHNMKNNLISILSYAEEGQNEEIIRFVEEIMENGGLNVLSVSNTGNIVVDSLVNFWHSEAKVADINFSFRISIPMQMTFQSADLCLILGNMLENAVEAARKVHTKRYIKLQMKYDNGNLLIFLVNSFNGEVLRTKNGKIKSSKVERLKHGIGIESINRTVEKYNGIVLVDNSASEFTMRVLLYNSEE